MLRVGAHLETVHADTPHKADMHPETPMYAGAGQTEEDAELGAGPLW